MAIFNSYVKLPEGTCPNPLKSLFMAENDPKKNMEKYLKTIYVVARRVSRSHGKGLKIYPLVNVNTKLWKDPPCLMGKLTINEP